MTTFPEVHRDIVTELFLNDAWRDVSTDVYRRAGIELERGRPNESSGFDHGTCRLTLDNTSGDYAMRNPMGQWYGGLNRNTPCRVCLRLVDDALSRTTSNGWGVTDDRFGLTWTVTGTTSNYAVTGGVATHALSAAGDIRISYLTGVHQRDAEIRCRVTVPTSNVTGGPIAPANLLLHGQGAASEYYMLRINISTTETVLIDFFTQAGLSITSGPLTVSGLTHTAGEPLGVAFAIEGHTLRGKVWHWNDGEPHEWTRTFTDVDAAGARTTLRGQPGWAGIRSSLVSGNSNGPITLSYDNIEVRSPRFQGEISDWPSYRDTSNTDVYSPISVNGVIRRLNQGETRASALRRYFSNPPAGGNSIPLFYWPMEDDVDAVVTQVQAVHGGELGGNMSFFQDANGNGTVSWASDRLLPGTLQAPGLKNGGKIQFNIHPDFNSTEWTVSWAYKVSFDADAQVYFYTGNNLFTIYMVFYTDGDIEVYLAQASDTLIMTYTIPAGTYDDVWHAYLINVDQNGANVDFRLDIDGVTVDTYTAAGVTMSGLRETRFLTPGLNNADTYIAHVAVWYEDADAAEIYDATFGYTGETSGTRLVRLCGEEGIPIEFFGDPDVTAEMGPQRVENVFTLIEDCAVNDMGTLYEPRGASGLAYRTRAASETQVAVATLNLSTKQIAETFAPVEDDQLVKNDVTAKRFGGGDSRYELTSGRMSVSEPADGGIGRYTGTYDVNCLTDTQLPDVAAWRVALGTVDEPRYPSVKVDFGTPAVVADTTLRTVLLDLNVDDRLVITGASVVDMYDDIALLARGYTERLTQDTHTLEFNCTSAAPYRVLILDDADARLDSGSSTTEDLTITETSVDVTTTGNEPWITTTTPYDAVIVPPGQLTGGERVTVTAVSGATSPQTLTVTRSVNGVEKTHPVGSEIHIFNPHYLGL